MGHAGSMKPGHPLVPLDIALMEEVRIFVLGLLNKNRSMSFNMVVAEVFDVDGPKKGVLWSRKPVFEEVRHAILKLLELQQVGYDPSGYLTLISNIDIEHRNFILKILLVRIVEDISLGAFSQCALHGVKLISTECSGRQRFTCFGATGSRPARFYLCVGI